MGVYVSRIEYIDEMAIESNDTVRCRVVVKNTNRIFPVKNVKLHIVELPKGFKIVPESPEYGIFPFSESWREIECSVGDIDPGQENPRARFTLVTERAKVGWNRIKFRVEYTAVWKLWGRFWISRRYTSHSTRSVWVRRD